MKRKLTWLAGWLCAALALSLGFWLWANGDKKDGVVAETNGPQVTKPYPRERDERERRTKNPREEFEAARKRGMTEEEVRGIVEGFMSFGITFEYQQDMPDEDYMEMGKRARDWYRETLVEGFALTQVQELVLIKVLREYGKRDLASYMESLALLRAKKDKTKIRGANHDFFSGLGNLPNFQLDWLGDFGLSEAETLLRNPDFLDERQREMIGYVDKSGQWSWVNGMERTLDYGTTDYYSDLSDPFANGNKVMDTAGEIFPLSMWQVERLGDFEDESVSPHTPILKTGNHLDRVKFLTRSQLRTLLLSRPEMAGVLMKELGE